MLHYEAQYRDRFPALSDRADEIQAPLQALAAIAGNRQLPKHLEVALGRQTV